MTDNIVKLDDISEKYFGLSPAVARRRAALGTLPVPAFRLTGSFRGPMFVTVESLQECIARESDAASRLHNQMSV